MERGHEDFVYKQTKQQYDLDSNKVQHFGAIACYGNTISEEDVKNVSRITSHLSAYVSFCLLVKS